MSEPIRPIDVASRITNVEATTMRPARTPAREVQGGNFQEMLRDAISEVEELRDQADDTVRRLVAGEINDVSEALVAVERADLAFQTMMTVRGRVMAAYEEIMRMQL